MNLIKFLFSKLIVRALWISLLSTFVIHLLLSSLPAKRVSDQINQNGNAQVTVVTWDFNSYTNWLKSLFSSKPILSDSLHGSYLKSEMKLRTKNTLMLALIAFLLATFIGILTGTLNAQSHSHIFSAGQSVTAINVGRVWSKVLYLLSSLPAYIIAYCLFLILRSSSSMALAVFALSFGSGSIMDIARVTYNTHSRELSKQYMENALCLGLKNNGLLPWPGNVSWHAFRNSLISILPIVAFKMPLIISSAMVIEVVFSLAGLGDMMLKSLLNQDIPMLLTIVLISVILVQICVFLAELFAYILQPNKFSI